LFDVSFNTEAKHRQQNRTTDIPLN